MVSPKPTLSIYTIPLPTSLTKFLTPLSSSSLDVDGKPKMLIQFYNLGSDEISILFL